MPTRPTIRPAVPADVPALEALENTVFPGDRLSRRSLRYYVSAPTATTLVLAEDSDGVVGDAIVAYRRTSPTARLYSLAVRGDRSGQGLGRKLLAACEAAAASHGKQFLVLEVRDDNASAICLYKKAGYEQFGTYEDYYEDGATAIRFRKALG